MFCEVPIAAFKVVYISLTNLCPPVFCETLIWGMPLRVFLTPFFFSCDSVMKLLYISLTSLIIYMIREQNPIKATYDKVQVRTGSLRQ